MKLDTYLILFTNSKCIKDLIVRPKTIKLLEENIREKLHDIEFVSDFLFGGMDMTPKAQATKTKIDNAGNIKL